MEQIFSRAVRGGVEVRPFSSTAQVRCRGYSEPLQRAMVDFGADESFERASKKLWEHYGIEVPASAVRQVTEYHGERAFLREKHDSALPERAGAEVIIAEADGSMIPVVETGISAETGGEAEDLRKSRRVAWKEARLCMARVNGEVTPVFGATVGSAQEAGQRLWECAVEAGAGTRTKIHCVGDGAPWIAEQVDLRFGPQGAYLIDFYHLCDYLSAAAAAIAGQGKDAWMEEKKHQLKENRWKDVLEALRPHLESADVCDRDAPVRACFRYMTNRADSLDYKGALDAGLPIGSGEIESAHRYIIQSRLKLAGAWWKIDNAAKILSLRTLRANGLWNDFWNAATPIAA